MGAALLLATIPITKQITIMVVVALAQTAMVELGAHRILLLGGLGGVVRLFHLIQIITVVVVALMGKVAQARADQVAVVPVAPDKPQVRRGRLTGAAVAAVVLTVARASLSSAINIRVKHDALLFNKS
jgi:predicted secreted protein